ncbi:MAG: AraC family transcriptional regulator, partial [bacterium]
KNRISIFLWPALSLIVLLLFIAFFINPFALRDRGNEKSIAVLPFKNDSRDSSNLYLINGLMESILNNLQQIKDLRVISRTSMEKYREATKSIPEIAAELDVQYFVEGSGQKVGDQVLLNIQLIDAQTDHHLWSEQFERKVTDIFMLQQEIARQIAEHVKVTITPEEAERMEKAPTQNPVAYDYFLQGLDLLYQGNNGLLPDAIARFHKALVHDKSFARAYAAIAISYYSLDEGQIMKVYADSINKYADQALLYDHHLAQSLIAKALFYMNTEAFDLAIPYFEKALEYNPNSALVIGFLTDYYVNRVPDTEKYLEYALKGVSLDIHAHDSITASFIYLHLSNAFIQSGFEEEAEKYIELSLDYFPGNMYSAYVKPYIQYTKHRDLERLLQELIDVLEKYPDNPDILQEVGKVYYYLGNYQESFTFYRKFNQIKKAYQLNIYPGENAKIGFVYEKVGREAESMELFAAYKEYAEKDRSVYRDLSLSAYYAWQGDSEKSMEYMEKFAQREHYHYWIILFLDMDPLFEKVKNLPAYRENLKRIEKKFWEYHREIERTLKNKELI